MTLVDVDIIFANDGWLTGGMAGGTRSDGEPTDSLGTVARSESARASVPNVGKSEAHAGGAGKPMKRD
jgi:hypothetical protein